MKRIPTIFLRDMSLKCTPVKNEINPECQWVFDGEGIATRKIDGVNIKSKSNVPTERIKPVGDYTEAQYGPVGSCKYIQSAIMKHPHRPDGLYEAYGEGIRGNPEKVEGYHMVRVQPIDMALRLTGEPKRMYRDLMGYFATHDIEGIVYHHRDGRMAKVKTSDFYHLARP